MVIFGFSAMSNVVETGTLKGRPFGGLMTLIKNCLLYTSDAADE